MPPKKKSATTRSSAGASKKATSGAVAKFEEEFVKAMGVTPKSRPKKPKITSTGSLSLDYALAVGGIPSGRIIEMWGPEHAGKTTLAIIAAVQHQKAHPDKRIAWVDMEQCLSPDELVRLADGRRVPARDLVGQQFDLFTSSPDGHTKVAASADYMSECEIFEVATESGRTLKVNAKHPLYRAVKTGRLDRGGLRIDGWTEVKDLRSGDLLAVPTKTEHLPDGVHATLTPDEAVVLGMLVGDGSLTHGHSSLTTPDGPMVQEFKRRVSAVGDEVVQRRTPEGRCPAWGVRGANRGRGRCHTKSLLNETGLWGTKSPDRFIPDLVFSAKSEVMAEFLGGLFAADGHFHIGTPSPKQPHGLLRIELDTTSRRLAADVQEALLRFGVTSSIRTKRHPGSTSALPSTQTLWTVQVTQCRDQIRFVDAITVYGKQEQAETLRERALTVKASSSERTWRTRGLNPDLRWEKVKSIRSIGHERTVGITVPDHHTYLSMFWEHNTFDEDWAEMLGLDMSKVWFYTPETAEDVADAVKRFVRSGLCSFIVLDSVGGMISRMEIEKEADEATVGNVPKIVTRMVKIAAPAAAKNGSTLCVINQVRASIGGYGPDEDTGGGWALKHVTTMKLQVRKTGGEGTTHTYRRPGDEKPIPVGHKIAVRVQKNKMGPQGQVAEIWLHNVATDTFGPVGFDPISEAFGFAKRFKLMGSGAGGNYEVEGEKIRGGEAKVLDHLRQNPDVVDALRTKILAGVADLVNANIEILDEDAEGVDPLGMAEMADA